MPTWSLLYRRVKESSASAFATLPKKLTHTWNPHRSNRAAPS